MQPDGLEGQGAPGQRAGAPLAGDKPQRYMFSFPILGVTSRFGGFRVWGGVLEVYWIACFHSNHACRLPPAQRGMNYGAAHASHWIRALALTVRPGRWVTLKLGTSVTFS